MTYFKVNDVDPTVICNQDILITLSVQSNSHSFNIDFFGLENDQISVYGELHKQFPLTCLFNILLAN